MPFWPKADDFAPGSLAPHTDLRGYYGIRQDAEGGWNVGRLHDGYGSGAAAARWVPQETAEGDPLGFVRRQEFAEDVRVDVVLRKAAAAGTAIDAHLVRHGVIARMNAASSTPAASSGSIPSVVQWFEDTNGYVFDLVAVGGGQLRLRLLRYALGVPTVLEQSDPFDADQATWVLTHRLRLECTTNGDGSVDLVGSVDVPAVALAGTGGAPLAITAAKPGGTGKPETIAVAGQTVPLAGSILGVPPGGPMTGARPKWGKGSKLGPPGGGDVIELLTHTDPSGTSITGAGRCGFILDDEVLQGSGARTVSVADEFTVTDLGSPQAVLWSDDFGRAEPDGLRSMADVHGTLGRDLTADYSSDGGGVQEVHLLKRDVLATGHKAEQAGTIDPGQAVDLDLASAISLALVEPALSMPTPNPATLRMTASVWAKVEATTGVGYVFSMHDRDQLDGVSLEIQDAGGGDWEVVVRIGANVTDTPAEFTSDPFAAAPYVGQAWCWTLAYDADGNALGNARVQVYVGRSGSATLLGDFTHTGLYKPQVVVAGEAHSMGFCAVGQGVVVDRYAVYFDAFSATQVDALSNALLSQVQLEAMGNLVHLVDFDAEEDGGSNWLFPPDIPAGVTTDTGKWDVAKAASTLVDGLAFDTSSSLIPVVHMRPPDSTHDQARSVKLTVPDSVARGGMVMRGSGATAAALTGYLVMAGVGNPAPVTVERWVGGVPTLLAQSSTGAAFVTQGVEFDLDVTVQRASPDIADSAVLITVEIDDVQVELLPVPGVGAAVDASGRLVDSSVDRILGGAGTGPAVLATAGGPVVMDDWTVADIVTPPGASTAPAIELPTEDAEAFGDLGDVLTVEWMVERNSRSPRQVARMEDGRQARHGVSTYERRSYRLQMGSNLPTDSPNFSDLRDFMEAHQGAGRGGRDVGFSWTPPAAAINLVEPSGTWLFASDRLQARWTRRGTRVVAFDIVELVQSGTAS